MTYCDWILNMSNYYDDESDKKRTLANIRDSLSAYCVNFLSLVEEEPVFVSEDKQFVGIELPFSLDVTISYTEDDVEKEHTFNFIGKIDGVHVHKNGGLIIHENKTASRLDDAWLGQWTTSHQITGYCYAASCLAMQNISQARVLGMQIPVPKYSGYSYRTDRVDREQHIMGDWGRWVLMLTKLINDYKNTPEKCPMCTNSCSAYYSLCNLMCVCTQPEEKRKEIIDEMIVDKWSPLNN